MSDDEVARLKKRLEREKLARNEAESMLETKSLELYRANVSLRQLADDLERQVELRTRELELALDDATAATRAKSEFLATMSHEIRTPLFGVIGTAELLEQSELDPEQSAQVRTIRSSGEGLLTLLNEILDFSKLDAARLDLQLTDFDLEAEGRAVADLFRPVAASRGLALSAQVSPEVRLVRGDRMRVRQIISNLLSNAVKFTTEGEVELTITTRAEHDRVEVTISVRDTGPGIPESDREVLFEEFRQGDPSTTRIHGGTGLGLAIVSRLAQLMGGSVTLETEVGKGSTFTARVVVDEAVAVAEPKPSGEKAAARAAAGSEKPAWLSALRVLLAEDNPVNRTLATFMLEKLGSVPEMAVDGGEALAAVQAGGIDLVLMDLQMPVLDGLEATRRIRALSLPRQPYIVALTANAFASDKEACFAAGMDDFISKPFTLADLRQLFERVAVARQVGGG